MSINGRIIADFELADGRRKQPTQYEAPQKGDKMKAIYVLAVGLMKLNETATAVAADLIWYANSKTGRCDPSVDRISFEINRPGRSVIRALQELVDAKVILKQRRGQSTNAYHIDWTLLRKIHAAFEERARGATHGTSGVPRIAHRGVTRLSPFKKGTHEVNPSPERATAYADAEPDSEKNGKQEKGERKGRRSPEDRRNSRRYRQRRKAGCRIFRIERDEVATEALLEGLGYLDEAPTKKEIDAALARFLRMVIAVSNDDMRFAYEVKKWTELAESLGDEMQ